MTIIEACDLTKKYKQGNAEIFGADNVNIKLAKGELVAISGKSGSGKTTLLNLLGTLSCPTGGKIYIEGIDILSLSDEELSKLRRTKIGYIFQNFNLIPILTARENIMMPTLLDSKKADDKYINELANALEISDRLDHFPHELSGGQKQRVAIARALINKPSIILADEPTGNLNRQLADDIIDILININKTGTTIILVTHDSKLADMCQRRFTICDGAVVEEI